MGDGWWFFIEMIIWTVVVYRIGRTDGRDAERDKTVYEALAKILERKEARNG